MKEMIMASVKETAVVTLPKREPKVLGKEVTYPLLEEPEAVEVNLVELNVIDEDSITKNEVRAKAKEVMSQSEVEPKGEEYAVTRVKGAAKIQLQAMEDMKTWVKRKKGPEEKTNQL